MSRMVCREYSPAIDLVMVADFDGLFEMKMYLGRAVSVGIWVTRVASSVNV